MPLRANAGNVGFYRVAYDDATATLNRAALATLPDDDKIALLDDTWALAMAGKAPLRSYFALVGALGGNRNPRAWEQIAAALAAIERDERGTRGEHAFALYARGVLRPTAAQLGFDDRPRDAPTNKKLRHVMLTDLRNVRRPGGAGPGGTSIRAPAGKS